MLDFLSVLKDNHFKTAPIESNVSNHMLNFMLLLLFDTFSDSLP